MGCGRKKPVTPTFEAVPSSRRSGSGPTSRARSPADVRGPPAARGGLRGQEGHSGGNAAFYRRALRAWGGLPPPSPGCLAADTQMLLRGLTCDRGTGSRTSFNHLWPAGCVHTKVMQGGSPLVLSICPTFGLFKERFLKSILVWYWLVTVKLIHWNCL